MPVSPVLLNDLLTRHAAVLEVMARRWCDEPEDCVQEAIVKLACMPDPPAAPEAWLYRVVRNEAISRGRRAATRRRHEQAAGRSRLEDWFLRGPGSGGFSTEQAAEALGVLDDAALELVLLRVWGRLTLAEIADAVGSSPPTVHRRYREAMARLRTALETQCPDPTR